MADRRYVCVYCGSRSGNHERYVAAAQRMGAAIAEGGYGLVYGGGGSGLMGVLADAVLAADAPVTGVIPRALVATDRELSHSGVTELLVVDDMHQRKTMMTERASAFVAMPGGYGTMEELFEMVAWLQLQIHDRPIGLLNTGGYYDRLAGFLDHAVAEGFLGSDHRGLLQIDDDPVALLHQMLPDSPAG